MTANEKIQVFLGLVPGLVWLWFFLREDPDGEPPKTIAAVFLIGGAFAFLALLAQVGLNSYFKNINISINAPLAILVMAGTEEIVKFVSAYLGIHRNPAFDVPADAMIYMVVAALGFATVENLGAIMTQQLKMISPVNILETATFRFAGATLLHALASGIVGYHWARATLYGKFWLRILTGLILGTGLHAMFNYLIITNGQVASALFLVILGGLIVLKDFQILNQQRVNIQG